MYGFEAHIAANKAKTFWVMLGFTAFMGLLGWLAGYTLEQFAGIDRVSSYFILAGCIFFAIFGSGLAYWNSDKIICSMVNARPANPGVYIEKYFIDCVEGLVLACGLPAVPTAYVIESEALNAFATGRDPEHSIVCVTTGLLQQLDRQELEGVIAHEMSHVYNRDILLMGVAAVLVGGIAMFSHVILRMLQFGGGGRRSSSSRDRDSNNSGAGILAIVGIIFIILAPIAASLLNMMLSRKREFLADATAVKLTRNPDGLVAALSKIGASDATMPFVEDELSALFIEHPQRRSHIGSGMAAAMATHPPIEERIAALKAM